MIATKAALEQMRYCPLLAKGGNIGLAFCATQCGEEPENSGNLVSPDSLSAYT